MREPRVWILGTLLVGALIGAIVLYALGNDAGATYCAGLVTSGLVWLTDVTTGKARSRRSDPPAPLVSPCPICHTHQPAPPGRNGSGSHRTQG